MKLKEKCLINYGKVASVVCFHNTVYSSSFLFVFVNAYYNSSCPLVIVHEVKTDCQTYYLYVLFPKPREVLI